MHFHIVKMYKDKEVNKNVKNIFLSMCDVNTICRRSWFIAAHIWKIYDFKIEVVPFIINFSTELITVVKFEVYVQKWCGRSCICGLFNFQLWRIYQWKKFCKSRINLNSIAKICYGRLCLRKEIFSFVILTVFRNCKFQ